MKGLVFLLFGLVLSVKKVLIAPLSWAYSHDQAAYYLAERLSEDPQYECYIVLDHLFNPPWPIKCNIIRLPEITADDNIIDVLEDLTLKAEEGMSNAIDQITEVLIHSYKYWEKGGILKQIEDIGIDIAICDSTNAGCKVAAHKLKIPFVMYFWPMCLPGAIPHKVPIMTSYVPIASVGKALSNMGFFKRFLNMLGGQVLAYLFESMDRGFVKNNIPEAVEYSDWRNDSATRKDTILIYACLPTFHHSELLPPNIINIGPVINKKTLQYLKIFLHLLVDTKERF